MLTPAVQHLDLAQNSSLVAEAQRVLAEEAAALYDCCTRIDVTQFALACRLIARSTGRVVVTGMGKSGAIGRKFAGTLSSTGTPAHFLHPAEAMHGDVGVVAPEDVVCAFSYSGETDELRALLPTLSRLQVPIISFTAYPKSSLGHASTTVLNVEVAQEACPLNLAPTTSTTVMLAFSDALALVVMQAKQFTTGDFALRHPAGALGRRLLLRVRDIMRQGEHVAIVKEETPLLDAMGAITRAHAGAAIVIDSSGKLAGLVTEGDWRRCLVADPSALTQPVSSAMNPSPGTVLPDILAAEGLRLLEQFHPVPGEYAGDAPVIEEGTGRPLGMLTLKDLVRAGIATRAL